MTKIYLVRHCEAIGNVTDIFQGVTDLDITELGEKQLKFLKERFENIQLDCVYSSPLIRTRKTANAIIGNKSLSARIEKGLIEIDGGVIEGKNYNDVFSNNRELAETWLNKPQDFLPEGGESTRDAYERIWKTVKQIASENKGKTVACATHGGVMRCLICRLLNGDIEHLKDTPFHENTGVTLIEFDDNLNANLVFYNDFSHLPSEFIGKKKKTLNRFIEVKK